MVKCAKHLKEDLHSLSLLHVFEVTAQLSQFLNVNLQNLSFLVSYTGNKETQETELCSEVVIYTFKLEIVWTGCEHLHNTVHAIKRTQ